MNTECAYSFADLFKAAFGRMPNPTELASLYALPQEERNEFVEQWANLAGWQTEKRVGKDKKIYTAFWAKN